MRLCTLAYPDPVSKQKVRINTQGNGCDINIDVPLGDVDLLVEMIKIAKELILARQNDMCGGENGAIN